MSNNVEQVPITVAGNILSELSEKIPNNIIALNELIKNAYDAKSPKVDIVLDSKTKQLTIRDYGEGMDKEGIEKLFHISSSDKKYGKAIPYDSETQRLTQGSKGLGFLSVFKFGKRVSWKTAQNGQISEFAADFDSLVTEYNITDKQLDITVSNSDSFRGTLIQIEIDDYNVETLSKYFSEEKNRNKILNSFIDDKIQDGKISADQNFIINFSVDGESKSTDYKIQLGEQNSSQQLFRIRYSSDSQKIVFSKENQDIYSEKITFNSSKYSIDMDLVAYSLKANGKSNINSLFYNPNTNELTPLIYINNNLFNNYTLFNTELMTTKKYSEVLKQLIGYISIKSSDSSIQFNSDRTQFAQSELTDEITRFIEKLNEETQKIGSSLKNELRDLDAFIQKQIPEAETSQFDNLQNYIKEDFKLKRFIKFEKQTNKIKCTLFDKSITLDIIPRVKEEIDLGAVEVWIGIDGLNKKNTNLKELIQVATEIHFNGDKVNEFYETQEGELLTKKETDSTITSLKTKEDFKLKRFIKFEKQKNKIKCTLFDKSITLGIIPRVKEEIDLGAVEVWIVINGLNKKNTNLKELIQVATEIRFNGDKVNEFNETQEGEWLIKKETDSTITSLKIIVRKPIQPNIDIKKIDLLCNIDYDLDRIFTLYNSFGMAQDRIEPDIKTNGNNTIRYDSREGKIRFGRTGEQTITVSAKDKDTNLKYESDFTFRIKLPEEYEIKPEQLKQSLIRLPITETPNFSSDIKVLINEINELFKTDYSIIPVISYRTLIELTVNDILNNIGEEKKTDLSKNYNKVISIAEDRIKNSRLDDKDKQKLLGIYKSIQSQSEVNAFIAFLNLSVHNGARIITKEDVKTKTQEIQLLLVLLHLTTL